jgi:acyl-CoA thioesterase YciA
MTMHETRQPAIRVVLLPRDTNQHGTIFGGVILSYLDQAGAIEAYQHGATKIVTVSMEKVIFHQPVNVGDLMSLYGELVRVGRTSITVKVVVEAHRPDQGETPRKVTEAEITYVNLDASGKPAPFQQRA